MDIEKELSINQILLSVFSKEYYNESLLETMRGLKEKGICYVTLNKTSESLNKSFLLNNLKTDSIFFIDAVSRGIGKAKEKKNTIYVSSPSALTELSIAITEVLKSGVFDIMLFDSLSTLSIYELGTQRIERFTSHVVNKIKSENKKGVFTCLEEDIDKNGIRNLFMYVDKVIRFTELYNKIERKKQNTAFAVLGIIALFTALLFIDLRGNAPTSAFVAIEKLPINYSVLFIFLLLFVIMIFFMMYKRSIIKEIPPTTLKNIKPTKQDTKKLSINFKKKIYDWFEKTNNK